MRCICKNLKRAPWFSSFFKIMCTQIFSILSYATLKSQSLFPKNLKTAGAWQGIFYLYNVIKKQFILLSRRFCKESKKMLDGQGKIWYSTCTSLRGFFFCALISEVGYEKSGLKPLSNGGAEMRVKITLACTECKQRNYNTKKNKKNTPDRLEMNKYCRFCKKHTLHRETK